MNVATSASENTNNTGMKLTVLRQIYSIDKTCGGALRIQLYLLALLVIYLVARKKRQPVLLEEYPGKPEVARGGADLIHFRCPLTPPTTILV